MLLKKIVVVCGSNNIESTTYKYINSIIKKCKESLDVSESIIYTPLNTSIQLCKGCNSCFTKGSCPLDINDSLVTMKKDLLSADLILWGTPVYFHQVSGYIKCLIDRISYWGHLFRLRGKPSVVVVSASNNGLDLVADYMNKLEMHLGLINISTILLDNSNLHCDNNIDEYVNKCLSYLLEEKSLRSTQEIEMLFKRMKTIYSKQKNELAEYKFWKENGYFDAESYQHLLNAD